MPSIPFGFTEIFSAAFLSLLITFTVLKITNALRTVNINTKDNTFNAFDLNRIQNRCYRYFPKETLLFNGETFMRGMSIKVQTYSEEIFEGIFLGISTEDVICILTMDYIVAYKLDGIRDILTYSAFK